MSVTPAIGVSTGRIRVTCHDESGERRKGSSAGRSGEHLTGSGDLTNQSGAHPAASGKCEKLYNHSNRWGGITTDSGILRSVYLIERHKFISCRKETKKYIPWNASRHK